MPDNISFAAHEPALLFNVRNAELHAYIQRYPLLTGPDETLNKKCFAALIDSIERREPRQCHALKSLTPEELSDEPAIRAAAAGILNAIDLPANVAEESLKSRAWKMCLVPADRESVLALGCGAGDEIAALRARLPKAEICGLDWTDKVTPGLLKAAQAEFYHGNFNNFLAGRPAAYDLIFSNHVLEHSFDPDALFAAIYNSLKPGGCLVSALPLDGDPDSDLFGYVHSLASSPGRITRGDMMLLLPGHPYKTNASDLTETVIAAGFKSAAVLHRPWHPTLFCETFRGSFAAACARRFALHRATFGLAQSAVRKTFGTHPPPFLLRAMGAVESRVPLGSIRLYVRSVREAVIIARK